MRIDAASTSTAHSASAIGRPQPGNPEIHKQLIEAKQTLNAGKVFGQENELTFRVDRQSRQLVMQIVNRETGELVRQVPPEYVLRLARDFARRT
jgi:uncharacterized FlaG/YvyC family protein